MAVPGDGRVVIKIDIDFDDSGLAAARAKIKMLADDSNRAGSRLRELSGSLDDVDASSKSTSKSLDKVGKSKKSLTDDSDRLGRRLRKTAKDFDITEKAVGAFAKVLSTTLKFGLIAAAVEFAAVGLALSTVNGLLAIGTASVKVYRWTLAGVSYAAAAATAALATVAAAQREYNAALVAYRYNATPHLGTGTQQAMSAMRMLTSDAELASFGMEALNSTFAAVSKNAELTAPLKDALKGIGDFAIAAGGDIGKNLAAAGTFVGLLQKEGKITADVLTAAGEVSVEFQKAVENAQKMGMTGAQELMKGLSSGVLSDAAGFGNALEAVNDTLFGKAKAFFTQTVSMFADLGQRFLPDVSLGFDAISRILRVTFQRIAIDIQSFGIEKIVDDIVILTDRVTNLFAKTLGKYLPQSEGMFSGLNRGINLVIEWFGEFEKTLQRLSPAARVLTDAFGPFLKQIVDGLGASVNYLANLLTGNQEKWAQFGDGLGNALTGLQSAFNAFKNFVVENLPLISNLLNLFGYAAGAVATALNGLAGIANGNNGLGAIAAIFGVGGAAVGLSRLNQGLGRQSTGRLTGPLQRSGDRIRERIASRNVAGTEAANSRMIGNSQNRGMSQMTASTVNINATTVYLNSRSMINNSAAGGGRGGRDTRPVYGPHRDELLPQSSLAPGATRASDRALGRVTNYMRGGGTGMTIGALGAQAAFMGAGNEASMPFVGIGSMVSMFNPLAGLGISGLGTAATADTAAGGGLAGMAGGASVGMLLGGPAGAAIGAGIAGLGGLIVGAIREESAKNDAIEEESRLSVTQPTAARLGKIVGTGGLGLDGRVESVLQEQQDIIDLGVQKIDARLARATGGTEGETLLDVFKGFEEGFNAAGSTAPKIIGTANRLQNTGQITGQQADFLRSLSDKTAAGMDAAYEGQVNAQEELIATTTELRRNITDNLDFLTGATGKSAGEIEKLAQTVGIDLTDSAMQGSEMLERLGYRIAQSTEEYNSMIRGAMLQAREDVISPMLQRAEAKYAIDQASEEVYQRGGFGTGSEGELNLARYLDTISSETLALFPDDPMKALERYDQVFSEGGTAFQPEGQLEGIQLPADFFEKSNMQRESMITAAMGGQADQLIASIAKEDAGVMVDRDAIIASLRGTYDTQGMDGLRSSMGTIQAAATNENFFQGFIDQARAAEGYDPANDPAAMTSALSTMLTSLGLKDMPVTLEKVGQLGTEWSDSQQEIVNDFRSAFNQAVSSKPPYWDATPAWWNTAPSWWSAGGPDGDSTTEEPDTPTSRLASTLMRHGMYDSMLAGKRNVTSSFRTDRLGSLKSDHVTGNAYDLVGQNLVGYAAMVNRTGGFAEFHGSGGDRHLHVVPGMPVGDAVSPMPAAAVMTAATGSSTIYNISVNAAPGQNPNAIADAVMARIDARDRDMRERS